MCDIYFDDEFSCYFESMYVDLNGNPIKHTPLTHPYNYNEFVVYKSNNWRPELHYSATYSDRMLQWDAVKFSKSYEKAFKHTGQLFNNAKPEAVQNFLSLYFDKTVELIAILQGCNVSNGNPYWVFIYNLIK